MRRSVLATLVSLSITFASLAVSQACGNSYVQFYVLSSARQALNNAERALTQGNFGAVVAAANNVTTTAQGGTPVRAFPPSFRSDMSVPAADWRVSVNSDDTDHLNLPEAPPADGVALIARGRMLRGIAIARMNGQLNSVLTPIRHAMPPQREARFVFALADLDAAVAANPTDPRAQAYQAEARARHDAAGVVAALATLRSLAQRDLLVDPWSWAELARIEDNDAARTQALARCAAIAGGGAAHICVP